MDNNTILVETAQRYYCQAPKRTDYSERHTNYTERLRKSCTTSRRHANGNDNERNDNAQSN
eukprot:5628480-Pyramimonas_sp.AAC.1